LTAACERFDALDLQPGGEGLRVGRDPLRCKLGGLVADLRDHLGVATRAARRALGALG
jgi:hypothetical protein